MKPKPHKCHFVGSNNKKFEIEQINNSTCEKVLGSEIDAKNFFNAHIDDICKKAERKLHALCIITPYSLIWTLIRKRYKKMFF